MGSANNNAREIERRLSVEIEPDKAGIRVSGADEEAVDSALEIVQKLANLSREGVTITGQLSSYLSELAVSKERPAAAEAELRAYKPGWICLNAKGKPILSKTQGQKDYVKAMQNNTVTFAIGPAGTGKTASIPASGSRTIPLALAVQAFRRHEVDRIILTRPAVEAGERLGFLPGDLQTKVDPYMRPLYDALRDLMGLEQYLKNMERGLIEVSPLAYMRGRTLDNAFIILDEAQNTTPEQMKMFLTRLGFDSKVVVTGDVTQIDLPHPKRSGLLEAKRVLKGVEDLAFVELTARDVVRNPMVQRIIKAYDKYSRRQDGAKSGSKRSTQKDSGKKQGKALCLCHSGHRDVGGGFVCPLSGFRSRAL